MVTFNIKTFQSQVDSIIQELEKINLDSVVIGYTDQIVDEQDIFKFRSPTSQPQKVETELGRTFSKIREILKAAQIKKYVCPVLQSVTGDAFEISKILTPILASLSLTGAIKISLDPLLFAGISVIISRMGIAAFCKDYLDSSRQ